MPNENCVPTIDDNDSPEWLCSAGGIKPSVVLIFEKLSHTRLGIIVVIQE
jgi:hypothetical protein